MSLAVSVSFALPGAAAAASGTTPAPTLPPAGSTTPFAPGVPQSGAATPTSSTPTVVPSPSQGTATSGSSGLSSTGVALVVIGALALLVGISLFIWRDARRRAPVKAGARGALDDDDRRSKPGSKRQQKPRKLSPAERRRRKRGRAR